MSGARTAKGFQPIENYGVIGNMRSIALVSVEGSIDFLCYPDFDSPTIFAALLDAERGGSFALNPDLEEMRVKQLYLPNTNILLTRFLSESGVAEVTDFMPVGSEKDKSKQRYGNHIIRMLRVIKGQVRFEMHCAPRFNYARSGHTGAAGTRRGCLHSGLSGLPEHGAARNFSAAYRWHRREGVIHPERG